MADKEIRIPHSKIQDSQKITQVQREAFKEHGVDMSVHEVRGIHDNFKTKERVIKVKGPVKYFFLGRR